MKRGSKAKSLRRAKAKELAEARASRDDETQLFVIRQRPGTSQKETKRLKARLGISD